MLAWIRKGGTAQGWGPPTTGATSKLAQGGLCLVPQQAADRLQRRMEGGAAFLCVWRRICHVPRGQLLGHFGHPAGPATPAWTPLGHPWTRLQQRTAFTGAHYSAWRHVGVDGSMVRWVGPSRPAPPSQLPARDRILKSTGHWHATSAGTPPGL